MSIFTENNHVVMGLAPVADAFATTVYSDIVNLRDWKHVTFIIIKGVGTTGTSTVTVQACDDVTPSNRTAVAFKYRACTADDTWGALTSATTAGFALTAGSAQLYAVEVDAQGIVSSGYGYCQLKLVEVVDAAVLAGILIILSEPRYARATAPTALA